MINEQLKAYVAYCEENGLKPSDFANFNAYCESLKEEESKETPRA